MEPRRPRLVVREETEAGRAGDEVAPPGVAVSAARTDLLTVMASGEEAATVIAGVDGDAAHGVPTTAEVLEGPPVVSIDPIVGALLPPVRAIPASVITRGAAEKTAHDGIVGLAVIPVRARASPLVVEMRVAT